MTYQYAYCTIAYDGDNTFERGECKAFKEELHKRFADRVTNIKVFDDWEALGENKLDLVISIIKSSKSTVVVCTPNLEKDTWAKFKKDTALMSAISANSANCIPVCILHGKKPETFSVVQELHFLDDWRKDHRSWEKLLKALTRNLKDVENYSAEYQNFTSPVNHSINNSTSLGEVNPIIRKEILTDDRLTFLSVNIGKEFLRVAINLGFQKSEFERNEADHRNNMSNQIYNLLYLFRVRSQAIPREKAEKLAEALGKADRCDLKKQVDDWILEYVNTNKDFTPLPATSEKGSTDQLVTTRSRMGDVTDGLENSSIQTVTVENSYPAPQEFVKLENAVEEVDNLPADDVTSIMALEIELAKNGKVGGKSNVSKYILKSPVTSEIKLDDFDEDLAQDEQDLNTHTDSAEALESPSTTWRVFSQIKESIAELLSNLTG